MNFNCAYNDIVPIHKLVPNPKNTNIHPEKQIELLSKIIDYQGQRVPVVVSKNSGFIVKGHGRLQAMMKLGWDKVAVDYQEYENEAQEYADLEADNRISELAYRDEAKAKEQIEEILGFDFDLNLIGLDELIGESDWEDSKVKDIEENDDPAQASIKVSCPEDIKNEVRQYLIDIFEKTEFRNIKID